MYLLRSSGVFHHLKSTEDAEGADKMKGQMHIIVGGGCHGNRMAVVAMAACADIPSTRCMWL